MDYTFVIYFVVYTLSQMFLTMFKPKEIKVVMRFIWSAVAVTSRRERHVNIST